MIGISSDGDSRLLASMKTKLKWIGSKEKRDVIAFVKDENFISVTQDAIHLFLKLRSRLLKMSTIYPMGDKQVSLSHLKFLINHFPKDVHGLVMSDVSPEDKQNYSSFEKITDPHVLDCLRQHVIGSEATVIYLQMSRLLCSPFFEKGLTPEERLERAYHGLYFFRGWRAWIQKSDAYNTEQNFITSNAFACMEINAYALVQLIIKLRDQNSPELFLPTLFTSQTCEKTFRTMRSMTTINWTRINFSLLELFHIASRIELINDIAHFRLSAEDVIFPRIQNESETYPTFSLPTDDAIRHILCLAQEKALLDLSKFGIHLELSDIIHCPLAKVSLKEAKSCTQNTDIDNEDECIENDEQTFKCTSLRDYAQEDMQVGDDSKFIHVLNDDGSSKCVLKSSLLWLMTEKKVN